MYEIYNMYKLCLEASAAFSAFGWGGSCPTDKTHYFRCGIYHPRDISICYISFYIQCSLIMYKPCETITLHEQVNSGVAFL